MQLNLILKISNTIHSEMIETVQNKYLIPLEIYS
jgi:hypothetical protein